jgi:hypothetical protein
MIAGSMHTTETLPRAFSALKSRLARLGTPMVIAVCTFIVVYGHPALAFAAQVYDEADEARDARLEGYASKVAMDTGGMGLTWIGFIVLAVVGVSALFKSSKRSHLD